MEKGTWTKGKTKTLINLWKSFPILYDSNNPDGEKRNYKKV